LITGIDNLRRLSVFVVLELAAAVVAGALFVWRQLLLPYPMLAVELFARPVFALSVDVGLPVHCPKPRLCLASFFSLRKSSADPRWKPAC
jgi:hypothetical protein